MKKTLHPPLALVVMIAMFGCNKPAPPKTVLDELIQKQRQQHIAIGWIDGQKLEFIVFGAKPDMRDYTLSAEETQKIVTESRQREKPAQISEGTDAQRSTDGKWMTYRTPENKFVLADSSGKVQRALLDGGKILTALYWSPDSEYLMYVEKSDTWDTGCLRYMEDGRDVMVYRLRDGQKGRAYQVCQGYPYTRFGWLLVPSNLPLS